MDTRNTDPPTRVSVDSALAELDTKVRDLELVCGTALEVNSYISGLPADRNHLTAAAFFNLVCFVLIQVRRMLALDPHRPVGPAKEKFQLRDSFSPTVLLRALFETYLNFFHMCVEPASGEARRIRFLYWDWHDCHDRLKESADSIKWDSHIEIARLRRRRRQLTKKICHSALWRDYPPKKQKGIFRKRDSAVLSEKREIALSAGISEAYCRKVYAFFSNYAHCGPIPVSHSLALPRSEDAQYLFLSLCADHAIWMGCFAIRDIVRLFPDACIKVHAKVGELTGTWEWIIKNWPPEDPTRPNSSRTLRSLR